MEKPSTSQLLYASLKYAYDRYVVSYFLYTMPYGLAKIITGQSADESWWLMVLGMLNITLLCVYGLVSTKQKGFIIIASALLVSSQIAYYAKSPTLVAALSLALIGVMILKLFVSRYHVYSLITEYDTLRYRLDWLDEGWKIYERTYGFRGYYWLPLNLKSVSGQPYPIFRTREEALEALSKFRTMTP